MKKKSNAITDDCSLRINILLVDKLKESLEYLKPLRSSLRKNITEKSYGNWEILDNLITEIENLI